MVAAAVVGGAAISAGASMAAGSAQADAAESAAAAQREATEASVAEQRRQFNLTRSDFAPYREIGGNALAELAALYGIGRNGLLPLTEEEAAARPAPVAAPTPTRTLPNFLEARVGLDRNMNVLINGRSTGLSTADLNRMGYTTLAGHLKDKSFYDDEGVDRYIGGHIFVNVDDLPEPLQNVLTGGSPIAPVTVPATTQQTSGASPTSNSLEAARKRFVATPGYQFRLEEGIKALDRSAAARGQLRGGGYARELERYGQGLASAEFENYANRLAALAGVGQSSTAATANAGQASANAISNSLMTGAANQGNALMAAGTARASGYAGIGSAINSGINNYLAASYLGLA